MRLFAITVVMAVALVDLSNAQYGRYPGGGYSIYGPYLPPNFGYTNPDADYSQQNNNNYQQPSYNQPSYSQPSYNQAPSYKPQQSYTPPPPPPPAYAPTPSYSQPSYNQAPSYKPQQSYTPPPPPPPAYAPAAPSYSQPSYGSRPSYGGSQVTIDQNGRAHITINGKSYVQDTSDASTTTPATTTAAPATTTLPSTTAAPNTTTDATGGGAPGVLNKVKSLSGYGGSYSGSYGSGYGGGYNRGSSYGQVSNYGSGGSYGGSGYGNNGGALGSSNKKSLKKQKKNKKFIFDINSKGELVMKETTVKSTTTVDKPKTTDISTGNNKIKVLSQRRNGRQFQFDIDDDNTLNMITL